MATGLLLATKGRSAVASRGLLNDAGKLEVEELELNTAYRHIPMTEAETVKPANIRRSSLKALDEEAEQPRLEPIHYFTQLGPGGRNVSMKDALADIRLKTGSQNPKELALANGKPLSIISDSGIVPKKAPVNWALANRMLNSSKAALNGAAAAAKTAH